MDSSASAERLRRPAPPPPYPSIDRTMRSISTEDVGERSKDVRGGGAPACRCAEATEPMARDGKEESIRSRARRRWRRLIFLADRPLSCRGEGWMCCSFPLPLNDKDEDERAMTSGGGTTAGNLVKAFGVFVFDFSGLGELIKIE